jgi:His-Xaa-Ser system protein HxsD
MKMKKQAQRGPKRKTIAAPKKGSVAREKAAAGPKKASPAPRISGSSVSFTLDVKSEGLEPIVGAAYMLTDRAYSSLDGDRAKKLIVTLTPKSPAGKAGLEALAESFSAELEAQKVRWAVAKNNLPIREYIAENAVSLANSPSPVEPAAEATSEELTDEQRSEIEKLISEVEDEIKTMNAKNATPDPKNVKASWEEAHETKAPEGKA